MIVEDALRMEGSLASPWVGWGGPYQVEEAEDVLSQLNGIRAASENFVVGEVSNGRRYTSTYRPVLSATTASQTRHDG